jgi:hypothetical protein
MTQKHVESIWAEVLDELLELGAITEADIAAGPGSLDTPGQRLLNILTEWGEALARWRIAQWDER